jgi:hypothetical protein
MGTVNTNSVTLAVTYWDGAAYSPVEDLVDETLGFRQSGFVSWQNKDESPEWTAYAQTPVTDVELYWIRVKVSGALSAGTTLQSVLDLFSDDNMLRVYYPEIVSDTRYLPPSRTNFLEQHVAARDLVRLRLKQRKVITDESQILDINEVSAAAVHACAQIILSPIDQDSDVLKRAQDAFNNEINELDKAVDKNQDGIVSDAERSDFGFTDVLRR